MKKKIIKRVIVRFWENKSLPSHHNNSDSKRSNSATGFEGIKYLRSWMGYILVKATMESRDKRLMALSTVLLAWIILKLIVMFVFQVSYLRFWSDWYITSSAFMRSCVWGLDNCVVHYLQFANHSKQTHPHIYPHTLPHPHTQKQNNT